MRGHSHDNSECTCKFDDDGDLEEINPECPVMHTCDSTAWRADMLHSQTQPHTQTNNHIHPLPHSQHAHTPSHTCADAQMPWAVCVLTPRRHCSMLPRPWRCTRTRASTRDTLAPVGSTRTLRAHTAHAHTSRYLFFWVTSAGPQAAQPLVPDASFLSAVSADKCACVQAHARRPRPPMLCLPTLAIPRSGAQQSAALRRNPPARRRARAPQIGATAYIWCVMAFLMSALMRAVLLNQYDGLCEKSGCPHESPVRPQSCTPKASSLDVHWRLNIFVTSLRTQQEDGNESYRLHKWNWKPLPFAAKLSASANSSQLRAVGRASPHTPGHGAGVSRAGEQVSSEPPPTHTPSHAAAARRQVPSLHARAHRSICRSTWPRPWPRRPSRGGLTCTACNSMRETERSMGRAAILAAGFACAAVIACMALAAAPERLALQQQAVQYARPLPAAAHSAQQQRALRGQSLEVTAPPLPDPPAEEPPAPPAPEAPVVAELPPAQPAAPEKAAEPAEPEKAAEPAAPVEAAAPAPVAPAPAVKEPAPVVAAKPAPFNADLDNGGARSYGMQKTASGGNDWSTIAQVHGGKTMAQAGGMGSAGPVTAEAGLDETLEDYQKVKSERRQAMDFCSGKFNAWKNVQKCIFLLLKNAHY